MPYMTYDDVLAQEQCQKLGSTQSTFSHKFETLKQACANGDRSA